VIKKRQIERTEHFSASASNPISYGYAATEEVEIVAVRATVHTQNVKCADGECRVSAQALFTVVVKTPDGFSQDENTVVFDVVFKNAGITDAEPFEIRYAVNDIRYTFEGSEYLISAIIDSEADFLKVANSEIADNIEGAIVKTVDCEYQSRVAFVKASGDFDGEKDCSYEIEKMLYHEECVSVTSVNAGINEVHASGEIISEFLLLTKRGDIVREAVSVPYKFEAECSDCLPEDAAFACACVSAASYRVENDSESRHSILTGIYTVDFTFNVFRKVTFNAVVDGFSQTEELSLYRDDVVYTSGAGTRELKYKCFGEASSNKGEDYVIGVIGGTVYAFDYRKEGDDLTLSGLVKADILVRGKDGVISRANAELPFECSFVYDGKPVAVTPSATKYVAKELDGKCVLECELIFKTQYVCERTLTVVTKAEPGEAKKSENCAVEIIFVEKGDDAWSVCKKAGVSENELLKQNPELTFPAEKDSGIVIYRKLAVE